MTALAGAEAGERRERCEPSGELVGEEDRVLGEVGDGVGVPPQPGLTADAARVRAEPAPVAPRTRASEQLRAHQDHVRVRPPQRGDVEAEALERARSEVLHDDVALADEREREATALLRGQVDAEAALAPVDGDELRRHVRLAAEDATLIGKRLTLDADDVG